MQTDSNLPIDIREDENFYLPTLPVPESEANKFRWTAKKKRFCFLIAQSGNPVQAATEAGYKATNAPNTAAIMLRSVSIQNEIARQLEKYLIAAEVSETTLIARWVEISEANVFDYFECVYVPIMIVDPDSDPALENPPLVQHVRAQWTAKPKNKLTDRQQRCVKKITIKNTVHGQDVTLELENRMLAIDRLAEVAGIIKTEVNQNANMTAEEQARALRDTLAAMQENDNGEAWPDTAESAKRDTPQTFNQ